VTDLAASAASVLPGVAITARGNAPAQRDWLSSALKRDSRPTCTAIVSPHTFLLRCTAPSDPDWKEFLVPDFGTRVEYPAGIFSVYQGKSEVGTGERFSTADKSASLTIYARANGAGETPAGYLRKNLRMPKSAIQYRRVLPSSAPGTSLSRASACHFGLCKAEPPLTHT
jgi:hypothetical protein